MDSDRFARFSKDFACATTRRAAVGALAALGLGGLMPRSASAKQKHKHHKKHHHKPAPFCAGQNYCDNTGAVCDPNGTLCGCFVTVETGEPFCGASARPADCADCTPAETCFDFSGEFCSFDGSKPTGCAVPCPDPL